MSNLRFPLADVGAFIDQRIPAYDVKTSQALSGKRVSSSWALSPLTTYVIRQNVLRSNTKAEYQRWVAIVQRLFGELDSCLLEDPEDNAAADPTMAGGGHCFAVGDGITTTFQLQRRTLGSAQDNLPGGPWRVSSGPRTNLLLRSQDFTNASWTKNTGTLVAANGCIAPDNTTANVITYSGAGSAGGARVTQAVVATVASPDAISVYLRADTPVTIAIGTSVAALSTIALTTSWTRYTFNVTPAVGGDVGLTIYSPAAVNTAFRIYAWGAQSELDLASQGATALIQTTSAAVTVNPAFWPAFSDGFLPVYDFNGPTSLFRTDYQGTLQLYPWARTNLCFQSQTYASAPWTRTLVSVGAAVAAPNGTTTALPLTASTSGASMTQVVAGLTAGQSYTVSIWLRCALGGTLTFSTTEGGGTVTITSTWQRFSRTFTAAGSSTTITLNAWSAGEIVEAWGAQLELGQAATSYIVTTTAAVSFTDYTLPGQGTVTFGAAPATGAVFTWTGAYFIRVRLAQPNLPLQRIVLQLWSTGLQLISVKP